MHLRTSKYYLSVFNFSRIVLVENIFVSPLRYRWDFHTDDSALTHREGCFRIHKRSFKLQWCPFSILMPMLRFGGCCFIAFTGTEGCPNVACYLTDLACLCTDRQRRRKKFRQILEMERQRGNNASKNNADAINVNRDQQVVDDIDFRRLGGGVRWRGITRKDMGTRGFSCNIPCWDGAGCHRSWTERATEARSASAVLILNYSETSKATLCALMFCKRAFYLRKINRTNWNLWKIFCYFLP